MHTPGRSPWSPLTPQIAEAALGIHTGVTAACCCFEVSFISLKDLGNFSHFPLYHFVCERQDFCMNLSTKCDNLIYCGRLHFLGSVKHSAVALQEDREL